MQISELQVILQATVLSGALKMDTAIERVVVSDILSDVMAKAGQGCLWVTGQTNVNVVAIAFFKGLAGVVLADRLQLNGEALAKAKEKEIPVLSSEWTAFQIAGELYKFGLRG